VVSKQTAQEKEESIRKLVRELTDEKRRTFFKESEKKLRDPDTYATLNYIFIAGLHHFYLGQWLYGLVNMSIFWAGIAMLFTDYLYIGVFFIMAVSIFELYGLFRSQVIVQDYNNSVMEKIYRDIHKAGSGIDSGRRYRKIRK
jgi:TM2 domain-containing membrane protein YozV